MCCQFLIMSCITHYQFRNQTISTTYVRPFYYILFLTEEWPRLRLVWNTRCVEHQVPECPRMSQKSAKGRNELFEASVHASDDSQRHHKFDMIKISTCSSATNWKKNNKLQVVYYRCCLYMEGSTGTCQTLVQIVLDRCYLAGQIEKQCCNMINMLHVLICLVRFMVRKARSWHCDADDPAISNPGHFLFCWQAAGWFSNVADFGVPLWGLWYCFLELGTETNKIQLLQSNDHIIIMAYTVVATRMHWHCILDLQTFAVFPEARDTSVNLLLFVYGDGICLGVRLNTSGRQRKECYDMLRKFKEYKVAVFSALGFAPADASPPTVPAASLPLPFCCAQCCIVCGICPTHSFLVVIQFYCTMLKRRYMMLYDVIWGYIVRRGHASPALKLARHSMVTWWSHNSKSKDGLDRVQGEVYDFQDTNIGNLAHPPCCLALSHHTERTRERKPSFTHIMQYHAIHKTSCC